MRMIFKNIFFAKPFFNKNGFTLLELLLVVGLMGLLAVIGAPMYLSLQSENEMNITSVTVADALRRAQLKAQAVDGDSAWGVEINTGTTTLFKGQNFVNRDQTFDENFSTNNNVVLSGIKEIIFSAFSGLPVSTGTIILQHNDGRKLQFSINELGIINPQ